MKHLVLNRNLLLVAVSMTVSMASNALTYDESVDGALSNTSSTPTTINLDTGANILRGAADNFTQGDGDFFTFTLAQGQTLSSINLNNYIVDFTSGFDSVTSFFGIGDASLGFPTASDPNVGLRPSDPNTTLFTGSLFGEDNLPAPGGDPFNLLSLLNRSPVDEEGETVGFFDGFTGTLGAGAYWIWISETADSIQYDLEFNIDGVVVNPPPPPAPTPPAPVPPLPGPGPVPAPVPVPASIFLLAGPLLMLSRFKKSRAPTSQIA